MSKHDPVVNDKGERKGGSGSSNVYRVKVLACEVGTHNETSINSRSVN
jgi:hypothetical protein